MQLILKQNIEFYIIYGVLEAKYWSGLPFSPPVDLLLLELSTMTHSSWVPLHGMSHNCTELRKPLTTTRVWSMLNFIFVFHQFHSLFFWSSHLSKTFWIFTINNYITFSCSFCFIWKFEKQAFTSLSTLLVKYL